MKVRYDYDIGTRTYSCPVCGYRYIEDTTTARYRSVLEGDEEFIKMESFQLYSTDYSNGWSSSPRSHTVYACPKCGTLQIEV